MSDQNAKNETAGEELFIEELAQTRGGQIDTARIPDSKLPIDLRPFTLAPSFVENGTEPPVFPGGGTKPKPLTKGLFENIVLPIRF